MKQEGTNFRIYANGEVVHQDNFKARDAVKPYSTDWTLYYIPDAILTYLQEEEDNPRCSFCKKTKKEIGAPVIKGKNANICYGCVATNKKKLDEEGGGGKDIA